MGTDTFLVGHRCLSSAVYGRELGPFFETSQAIVLFSCRVMLLDKVMWPVRDTDDEEDCDADSMCHNTGFLRTSIETVSSDTLVQLLRFWAGWEVLPSELQVEICGGIFLLHQRAWRH
ncbi:hypothetical protein CHARACLAT_023859 [Characodon lateralis]|uniref:Uncharacterized protein n=1 Tax=Characodon lateralis TaxID=208331 RepID=A0ABU7EFN4_9TELE|nr:hypothetical protein [Characodon lateralis]